MTLVTGGIATKFLDNIQPVDIRKDSYYMSIKDVIEHQPDHIPFGMKPEAFAHDVLRRVERGSTGKEWIGGGTTIARIALWTFPQWALVSRFCGIPSVVLCNADQKTLGSNFFLVEAVIYEKTGGRTCGENGSRNFEIDLSRLS
tara:strand:- start:14316 stop:14747 length:432 start_codon:yes stop_codon:yes gene_type:complete